MALENLLFLRKIILRRVAPPQDDSIYFLFDLKVVQRNYAASPRQVFGLSFHAF
jgi:hypothetical protein